MQNPLPERQADRTVLVLAAMLAGLAMLGPFSIMALFHGAISDSFGRRTVILVNMAVFVAASIGCALAQDFEHLLFFCALQGLAGGVGMVVGLHHTSMHCPSRFNSTRLTVQGEFKSSRY